MNEIFNLLGILVFLFIFYFLFSEIWDQPIKKKGRRGAWTQYPTDNLLGNSYATIYFIILFLILILSMLS